MNPSKRFLVLILIFQFYILFVGCPDLIGQYHFDSWTTDNGLPQNGVRSITQTPDGYLWFTTFDGLVRFDGVKFTVFNKGNTKGIINNRFTEVFCDTDGTLYAVTAEDGVLTIYRNGGFSSYDAEQVPGNYIRYFEKDANGELLFGITEKTEKEFWYYLRDGNFVLKEEIKAPDPAERIIKGKSGTVWTVFTNRIVETRGDGNSKVYPYKIKKFYAGIPLYADQHGGLWVGGGGLAYLKSGKIENFEGKHGFPADESDYHGFWEAPDGSLWFANGGSIKAGLGWVHYKDGKFSIFGKESGLSDTNMRAVFVDREKNIWLGTGKGLNRLKKSVITTKSVADGLVDTEVYPILRDSKNNIWLGTARGLSIYRDGKFESVSFGTGWDTRNLTVQSLFEDSNGKIWVGVTGGIYLYQNGKGEYLKSAEWMTPFSILQDRTGTIWVATDKGILRYKDYQLEKHYTVKDSLPKDFVTVAYEDSRGKIWFGGLGGLSEIENGKFINYTTEDGLTGNYVRSVYEDTDGTLWIGTYDEGLSRFKDGKFVNFKKENGLYSDGVFAIEEDSHGYFWITSNQGIYRVNKRSLLDFADNNAEKIISIGYDKSDGMLNVECNGGRQPASLRDENGNFWFPTQDGVAIVDPDAEIYNTLPPPVVIESATVEREKVDIRNGLTIEAGQKNVEINFTAISLIKSGQIKFKYKLEGHDTNWIDADTQRTAYYSYLPPGNYNFHVKAANSDGIWNEEGASLSLELKPFFYQTNLFYLLCIGLACLILLVVWKVSVFQLESREKHLAKLVGEKTEELKLANSELQQLANSDGLTKIGNRRRFEDFLSDEWHRAIRFNTEISLILLDIDHFKLFNDTYGHQEGDDCLKQVAEALKNSIHRPTDLVARFGGEEFAIVLGGTDVEGAFTIAEQVMENIKNLKIPHSNSNTSKYLTISVGVATMLVEMGMSETELIKAADNALYQAKENGRNQIISENLSFISHHNKIAETEYAEIA